MSSPALTLLISREEIATQVQRLGEAISRDHPGGEILLVGVLKGSFLFFSDLVRCISSPVLIDFVRLASYGSETQSSGIVEVRLDLEISVRDRDVIIVEDIIDSGLTLETLYHRILMRGPRSLKICTLIDKKARRETTIEADYVGITLEDGFIVGYGLDFDERYRNLPDIFLVENA
jgi:hypoxanthine phosphoribosyltransferase